MQEYLALWETLKRKRGCLRGANELDVAELPQG